MADKNLSVALKLFADAGGLDRGLRQGTSSVHRFTSTAKREFAALGAAWNSTMGRLGQIGLGVSAVAALRDSARLDKALTQTRQTAGETKGAVGGLRKELFEMGRQTGANVEDLQQGAAALVASGTSWKAALEDIKGINVAMAVTGADAKTLAGGLTVAGEAFQFDLEKPGLALELLDKMTVAGRKGNAELENLSDIFARIGVNSASAGLGFEKTLAFVETLSLVEKQPERLATLADSTLRLFTNLKYAEKASEASGIKFFDQKGTRRDPIDVLKDLRTQFQGLQNDQARAEFMGKTFEGFDIDTLKGLRTLLSGDALDKITGFEKDIKAGVGTLKRDLPDALNNAVDQSGRLKNTLREAADGFAQPVNNAVSNLIKFALDDKKLSGGEMMGGAAGLAAGAYVGSRLLKGLGGKALGTAGGVAVGKGLQEYAGVTPVYVVNMSDGGIGGGVAQTAGTAAAGAYAAKIFPKLRTGAALLGGVGLSNLPMLGGGAMATAGGLGMLSFGGGFGAGYGINKATKGTKFGGLLDNVADKIASPIAGWMYGGNVQRADKFKGAGMGTSQGSETDRMNRALQPLIEKAIDSSKIADFGQIVKQAVTEVGQKKADLTIRIVGQPAKVEAFSSQGFNLNVDTGLLGVGQ